jgi:predicted Zn-dependent protease
VGFVAKPIHFLAVSLIAAGCATSPTGRKQLMLVPESTMDQMGAQAFTELKQQTPTDPDPTTNAFVQCVAGAITDAAQSQTGVKTWDVVVFKDPQVNAFALPGGKIGVYQGLLGVTKNDAELATVLGHEVGHVIAKHGAERVSEQLGEELVLEGASILTPSTTQGQAIIGALGLGAQYGIALPHSRTQEAEADEIGLDLMARAGFDPAQSIELWKNMTAAGGPNPPEFLSDHPNNENRIADLQKHLPAAQATYQAARAAGRAPQCTPPPQLGQVQPRPQGQPQPQTG